jgi:hypothetical protein
MFRNNTVIIVGSGASKEVGLPTGEGLKKIIAKLLQFRVTNGIREGGDDSIFKAIGYLSGSGGNQKTVYSQYIQAAKRIVNGMPQAISIDNFLDSNQGDEKLITCGKLAIVQAILEAERTSHFYPEKIRFGDKINFANIEETWFTRFIQLLTEYCKVEEVSERLSHITFIVFNYDRCIEHYLYYALQNYYGIEKEQSINILSALKIYHPYGKVGDLPWVTSNNCIGFGGNPNFKQLLDISSQIKTFTESTDPNISEIEIIWKSISQANIILYLGFAYHPLNLDLLTPKVKNPEGKGSTISIGTAKGLSNDSINLIKRDLSNIANTVSNNVYLHNDLLCNQLFKEYWRRLSLAK